MTMRSLCFFITLFLLFVFAPANAQDNLPCDTTVVVPDFFAPCGDGVNALFMPTFTLLKPVEYSFAVFNRWGELLFETTSLSDGWTGRTKQNQLAGDGVYTWKSKYRYAGDVTRECMGHVNYIC